MFEDLDDDAEVRVPDDALANAKAAGAARVRRRYAVLGGLAAALLVAASIPLLTSDKAKTRVNFAHEPTTESSAVTETTESNPSTTQRATTASTTAPKSLVPAGWFARLEHAGSRYQAVISGYDGSERRVLESDTADMYLKEVRFSPDRTLLAVTGTSASNLNRATGPVNQLDVYDVTTGEAKLHGDWVSGAQINDWAWSPDSGSFAFISTRERAEDLQVYSLRGGPQKTLVSVPSPTELTGLHWSPDGRAIAYGEGQEPRNLFVVSVDTGKQVPIATNAGADLAWSPNSKFLAYSGYNAPTATSDVPMHVVGADGTGDRALTDQVETSPNYNTSPEWSPDGQWLLYARIFRGGSPPGLVVVDPGGNPDPAYLRWHEFGGRVLASEVATNWSADSSSVMTAMVSDGGRRLWNLNTANDAELTTKEAALSAWSPDQKWLAWTTNSGEVWVTEVATGARVGLVSSGAAKGSLDWTPDSAAVVAHIHSEFAVMRVDGQKSWRFGHTP